MPTLIENSVVRGKVIIPVGVTDPPFTDRITKANQSVQIEEVFFFMRPILSRHPVIDGEPGEVIKPPDAAGNNVQYKWEESDVSTEGEYMAWWSFTIEEAKYETPEFPIIISDHGPGLGTQTGGIVDGVADHMPVTLNGLRSDVNFGDRRLQKYATLIQLRVLNSYVPPDQEITSYSLPLLDYFSKRLALELCTPGIDYWMRQHRAQSAQGPAEMSTFPDAIAALEVLRERLKCELEQDWRDLRFLVPKLPQRRAVAMPSSSMQFEDFTDCNGELVARNGPVRFVTKDPRETQPLQTRMWGALDPLVLGFFPFP